MAKERIQHPEKFSPRIVFRTATVCNFKCPMCPHGNPHMAPIISAGKEMPMSLYSEALQNISQHTDKVGLSDTGEFMAEPDWKKRVKIIVDQAKKNPNLMFHQITNASLLTKKNLKHLNGLKKVTFLISIDGNEFLTYHTIRKPGSLHKTLPNIKNLRRNLKEVGITDVSIQLSMVLLKRNIFSLPFTISFIALT